MGISPGIKIRILRSFTVIDYRLKLIWDLSISDESYISYELLITSVCGKTANVYTYLVANTNKYCVCVDWC